MEQYARQLWYARRGEPEPDYPVEWNEAGPGARQSVRDELASVVTEYIKQATSSENSNG